MQAKLISQDGGQTIELDQDVTIVGRKGGVCDILLDTSSVSKLHCMIVKTDGLLFVRDLGSTNGTKVNGQRVTRGALLPGDELAFAGAKFRVYLGPSVANIPQVEGGEMTEMMSELPPGFELPESESSRQFHSHSVVDDSDSHSDVQLIPED